MYPNIRKILASEQKRQNTTIELIASENYARSIPISVSPGFINA